MPGGVLTNAAGGIAPNFAAGDRMLITDHLNLTGQNPLVGPHQAGFGTRFPEMGEAYNRRLAELAHAAARDTSVELKEGVYAGLLGPNYETPAEIRMLRTMGADAVGMSTVLEVIALRHVGVRVAAISCITNLAAGISPPRWPTMKCRNRTAHLGPVRRAIVAAHGSSRTGVINMNEIPWKALTEAASRARLSAYAPYSKYQVGAALLAPDGKIYPDATWRTRAMGSRFVPKGAPWRASSSPESAR